MTRSESSSGRANCHAVYQTMTSEHNSRRSEFRMVMYNIYQYVTLFYNIVQLASTSMEAWQLGPWPFPIPSHREPLQRSAKPRSGSSISRAVLTHRRRDRPLTIQSQDRQHGLALGLCGLRGLHLPKQWELLPSASTHPPLHWSMHPPPAFPDMAFQVPF